MARMTERSRWALLVLSMVVALGGGLITVLLIVESNERESQRDFCDLLTVFIDPSGPPPTTERGRRQRDALQAYLTKRCS